MVLDLPKPTALVSGVASDSHTWNLMFLQLLLEELGHEVHNLGACVGSELLVEQCLLRRPDLVVLSSVNGHGHLDGARMVRALRARPELASTTVIIGGKLGITGAEDRPAARALLDAGFDAVFDESTEQFRRFVVASVAPRSVSA